MPITRLKPEKVGKQQSIHGLLHSKYPLFLESYSCLFLSGLVDESFVRCNGRLGHLGNGERRKTADDRVHRECDPDDAVHRDGDVDV